ncbi:vacuolar sorting-associated 41 -like protein [Brachionus plicatilis]|uniref:Vacuolar sorting-associated 41-like protein n=1 Tax=Brachionus plicatilis TaxID=10195 RepID=A0A3M7PBD2_BRAPC|nr:vacuolar sorting-associated 41 -like protein [Brachionus plicatilis]
MAESEYVQEIEDEEESDYAEAEPVLAYSRIKNDVLGIIESDSVSCIKADRKFLIVGTHWGRVHVLDHDGNKVLTKEPSGGVPLQNYSI